MIEDRLHRLGQTLAEQELDALLIAQPQNLRYLSGFSGSGGVLLLTAELAILATGFVYLEQAKEEAPAFEVVKIEETFAKLLPELVPRVEGRRLGFESAHLTVAQHCKWLEALEEAGEDRELLPTEGLVEKLRAVKDAHELAAIRQAVALADAAFAHIVDFIKVGMTEKEVAWELEVFLRTQGAEKVAFDLIVGAGPNGAKPHASATEQRIKAGQPIVIDLGALLDGYNSDLTRTLCLGRADERFWEVYDLVLRAQTAAEAGIKAGLGGKEADQIARQIIEEAGYELGHSLGHGVGLAVHESPRLSRFSEDTLQAGMVVTVEPGIYLPDWGGVRLEDMVVVGEEGVEILSQASKAPLVEG